MRILYSPLGEYAHGTYGLTDCPIPTVGSMSCVST